MPAECNFETFYEGRKVFKYCFKSILLLYGSLFVFFHLSYLDILAVAVISIGSYAVILHYSLPPGDPILVKEIFGTDVYDSTNDDLSSENVQKNDNDFKMRVVAHRFAGLDAPENSLVALENAHKSGCYAVEFDVAITLDNVIVLFHDETLERMASKSDQISKMKWDQLKTINISANHPFRDQFQNAKIALFEDAVKKCLEYDMRMFIDIKDAKPEVIDGICKMFEKYPVMFRRAVVSSFNPWIVYQIRCRKPSIVGCLAWRPSYVSCENYIPEDPSAQKRRSSSPIMYYLHRIGDRIHTWLYFNVIHMVLGLSCVLIQKDTITKEQIEYWRSHKIRCLAWTVNQPSEKQHFAKNLRITYLTDTMHAD